MLKLSKQQKRAGEGKGRQNKEKNKKPQKGGATLIKENKG